MKYLFSAGTFSHSPVCIYLVVAPASGAKNLPYENLTRYVNFTLAALELLARAIFITSSIHLAPSPRAFTQLFYCLQGFSKLSGKLRSEVGPWLIESAGSRIFRPFSRRNPAIQTQRWRGQEGSAPSRLSVESQNHQNKGAVVAIHALFGLCVIC